MLILSILLGCLVLYRLQALLYRKYWIRGFSVSVRYGKHQVTEGEKVCVCQLCAVGTSRQGGAGE